MSSLRGRPEDTGALDGAPVLLGWRPSDDYRANTALTWIRWTCRPSSVADRKDMPLLSEDDFESSLDTACEAAAGSIEGVFGPASLTWRVDREAAVFLGAGAQGCPGARRQRDTDWRFRGRSHRRGDDLRLP